MDAAADENNVPNSMVALCAQNASVRLRNARRRYCPARPGTSAHACVDPSSARSAPRICERSAHEITEGVTTIQASPLAHAFSASRIAGHFLVDVLELPAA